MVFFGSSTFQNKSATLHCVVMLRRFEWCFYQPGPEACGPLLRQVGSRLVKELH